MMTDVRSMLKSERAARRIQHKHASYSTSGTLLCIVCHLQLKSESLWDGHLRSAGHILHNQKAQEAEQEARANDGNRKKRKASTDDEGVDTIRKRTKASKSLLPEGLFDGGQEKELTGVTADLPTLTNDLQMTIPERPATPLKAMPETPDLSGSTANVDEDEWAAFEADIAAAEVQPKPLSMSHGDGVISAPAMTAEELKKRDAEEDYKRRKERLEAEAEGDKEDAARKLEEEFEEMESLEDRVRKLREKREALRSKESTTPLVIPGKTPAAHSVEEDEEDSDDEDDDWDGFRMKS